jgi:hypothetical protein
MPVLLAKTDNNEILERFSSRFYEPRELIADQISLTDFVRKEMKTFGKVVTHYVLDVDAFKESESELLKDFEGILMYNENARLIFFSTKRTDKDSFLRDIYEAGFTNIAASYGGKNRFDDFQKIVADIEECFSADGLSEEKYKRFARVKKIVEAEPDVVAVKPFADFSAAKFAVAVVGGSHGVGATHFSVHAADFAARYGGKAAVIFEGDGGVNALEMFADFYSLAELAGGGYTHGGVDFFVSPPSDSAENYNVVVHDCGDKMEAERLTTADVVVAVGGVSWTSFEGLQNSRETLLQTRADFFTAINFADKTTLEPYFQTLSTSGKGCVLLPFSPRIFGAAENDEVMLTLLGKFGS